MLDSRVFHLYDNSQHPSRGKTRWSEQISEGLLTDFPLCGCTFIKHYIIYCTLQDPDCCMFVWDYRFKQFTVIVTRKPNDNQLVCTICIQAHVLSHLILWFPPILICSPSLCDMQRWSFCVGLYKVHMNPHLSSNSETCMLQGSEL